MSKVRLRVSEFCRCRVAALGFERESDLGLGSSQSGFLAATYYERYHHLRYV